MKTTLVLILSIGLMSCTSAPKRPATVTTAPSLRYSQSGLIDAKDFLSRGRGSNEEMRLIIKKLLEEAP